MRLLKLAMAMAAAFLLGSPSSFAQRVRCPDQVINISTGVDASGNILPNGTPDPKWQNAQGVINVMAPYSGWSSLSGSAWLGTTAGASNTDYVYTLSFSNVAPGTISFTALADNYVTVLLDGNQIAQTPGGPSIYGFQSTYATVYSGSVSAGSHVLTATVHNVSGPTGLNLSGSVVYSLAALTQDLSTGVNGTILPIGSTDPYWSGPVTTVTTHPSWDNLTGSAWLGNPVTYAAGTFTYGRYFYIPSGGTLYLEALADNYVQLYLDGSPITQTPGLTIYGFKIANVATYSAGITAGTHLLTADVTNVGGPLGVNVHAYVTYCGAPIRDCSADPAFTGIYGGGLTANFVSYQPSMSNVVVHHGWYFGDGGTSDLANPSHTYASAGNYLITHEVIVQVLDEEGNVISECKDSKQCMLTIDDRGDRSNSFILNCDRFLIKKQPARLDNKVSLSPNPAQNEVKIHSNTDDFDLQIIAIDGKEVVKRTSYHGADQTIDVSGLTYGTYIAVIRHGEVTERIRFVKVQ